MPIACAWAPAQRRRTARPRSQRIVKERAVRSGRRRSGVAGVRPIGPVARAQRRGLPVGRRRRGRRRRRAAPAPGAAAAAAAAPAAPGAGTQAASAAAAASAAPGQIAE